jgi:hypothetical protein
MSSHTRRARAALLILEVAMAEQYGAKPAASILVIVDTI